MIAIENNKIDYDHDHDILYIYSAPASIGYDEKISKGIYLRKNDDTDEIIGAVIINYKKFDNDHLDRVIPIDVDFVNLRKELFNE